MVNRLLTIASVTFAAFEVRVGDLSYQRDQGNLGHYQMVGTAMDSLHHRGRGSRCCIFLCVQFNHSDKSGVSISFFARKPSQSGRYVFAYNRPSDRPSA